MAIVFPREMPRTGVSLQGFRIQRVDAVAPEVGGPVGGVQIGFPLWTARWTLGRTDQELSDEWEAWLDSMRGAMRSFYGRDWRRPFPLAHIDGFRRMTKVGGAPFTGAAGGWSQSIDAQGNAMVTLTGVPAGLILSRIDYVDFRWDAGDSAPGTGDRRALVRVAEGARADATGAITFAAEPAVPTLVPEDATPHLDYPACVMKLIDGTEVADVDRLLRIKGSKLVAIQDLRP